MIHDSSGPRRLKPMLERLGAKVWDPSTRSSLITDHYVPALRRRSAAIIRITRDWVREAGIDHFHDEQGICHVVLPERGHLRPGMFAVGGDSATRPPAARSAPTCSASAPPRCWASLVTGEIWLKVPQTIVMQWDGTLAPRRRRPRT